MAILTLLHALQRLTHHFPDLQLRFSLNYRLFGLPAFLDSWNVDPCPSLMSHIATFHSVSRGRSSVHFTPPRIFGDPCCGFWISITWGCALRSIGSGFPRLAQRGVSVSTFCLNVGLCAVFDCFVLVQSLLIGDDRLERTYRGL